MLSVALLSQAPPTNVLLITIDTVRADHIGAYGYAKGGNAGARSAGARGRTLRRRDDAGAADRSAHAALLTGVYPARVGVRDNATTAVPSSATTTAELFKARGYRTGGFVGAFILDAPYGFAQGFDTFDAEFARIQRRLKLQAQRRATRSSTPR